ncbi:MAG: Clp protease ClpP [Methylococcales bacterium]|jgi:ATP-dependent protease ClpP protease subunit|nr:Clp protease ClpP [Methylococcales bacterium]
MNIANENNKTTKGFNIKAEGDHAEILIYDAIGSGMFGGLSAKAFVTDLNQHKNVKNITVRVNSPGGEVFDGTAIYNALLNHPAKIDVHIDGMALSMASAIAMAGDTVTMAENAMMMIHDPSISVSGTARKLRKTAETLDKTKNAILCAYARKTGKQEDEISVLMALETWMNAQEALDHGFIDAISEPTQIADSFDLKVFGFKRIPDCLCSQQDIKAVTQQAIAQERQRVQSILDIADTVKQPQMASELIHQGVSVEDAREQLFRHAENQQTSITSKVTPVAASTTNPLTDDAQQRAE